jgi:hypothetical protein
MRVTLVIVGGKANKGRVSLSLPIVIGRSRDADLTVAHPMISRKHCEIYEDGGLLTIRDLGSMNGTFVAGQQIKEASLKPADRFSVGPLTFRVDYDSQCDPETPGAAAPEVDPIKQARIEIRPANPEAEQAAETPPADWPHPAHGQIPDAIADFKQAVVPEADDQAPASAPLDETLQIDAEAEPSPADSRPADEQVAIAPPDGLLPDFSAWDDAAQPSMEAPPANQPPPIQPVAPPPLGQPLRQNGRDDASEEDPDLDDFLRKLE